MQEGTLRNAVVQVYCCSPVSAAPTWVTPNGTKENGRYWTKAWSSAVQSHEFCKYSPLLLGSSAGVHCSTSSGSKKSLFKTSMTCILLRLTRSTSFSFLSSCSTISLPDWLVKIVIWNTNHRATAASDSTPPLVSNDVGLPPVWIRRQFDGRSI